MFGKKSDTADKPTEEEVLRQRVDDMMAVKPGAVPGDPVLEKPAKKSEAETVHLPAISAPEVPAELLKKIKPAKSKEPEPVEKVLKIPDSGTAPEKPAEKPAETPQPEKIETVEPVNSEPPAADLDLADELENTETDKAVDDIVVKEADLVLAVEDAKTFRKKQAAEPAKQPGLFRSAWTWITILAVIAIACGVLLVLRYGYGLGDF